MLVIDKNHHLALIKDAFRGKNIQIQEEENGNGNYCEWKIGIKPGEFIIYKAFANNYKNIHIVFIKITYYSNMSQNPVQVSYKDVFRGNIPLMEDEDEWDENDPDFNFIEKLLKNYNNVGGC